MTRQQRKRAIADLLKEPGAGRTLTELIRCDAGDLINPLFSLLCHPLEIVRWNAVTAFGPVMSILCNREMDSARVVMRRFLWMLNDESGGIGWGVPEAMAESMHADERLALEYHHMLVSYTLDDGPELFQDGNFIEVPALQQGVLWGLARVADRFPSLLLESRLPDNLEVYFSSPDSHVRGLVCRLSGLLGLFRYEEQRLALKDDRSAVRLYLDGEFLDTDVATLAREGSLLADRKAATKA